MSARARRLDMMAADATPAASPRRVIPGMRHLPCLPQRQRSRRLLLPILNQTAERSATARVETPATPPRRERADAVRTGSGRYRHVPVLDRRAPGAGRGLAVAAAGPRRWLFLGPDVGVRLARASVGDGDR